LIITWEGSRYSLLLGENQGIYCDKQYGDWLHIWNELTQSAGHQLGYANMVGNIPQLTTPVQVPSGGASVDVQGQILYVPLEFWFNRNPGLALPLIALNVGQKSTHPCAFEHCTRESMFGSQTSLCY